jgi:soluble lytic murein transglycosylase-like protein
MDSNEAGLGLRNGGERRNGLDRRGPARGGAKDRRRSNRRQNLVRSALLALMTVAPHAHQHRPTPKGKVTSSIEGVRAIPAHRAYEELIQEAARTHNLDPALIRAVIRAESAFNPSVVSHAGAQGLMQLMPSLGDHFGVVDPFDPRQNIMAGTRYLKQLLEQYRGNVDLALAGYNAGPGAVARFKGVPPYRETRDYVKKIKGLIARARASEADSAAAARTNGLRRLTSDPTQLLAD